MTTVVERKVAASSDAPLPIDGLFVVWFDVNCGRGIPDWWWEIPGPQPLQSALDLSAELRAAGWLCQVMSEHQNPRPDGRWDNP